MLHERYMKFSEKKMEKLLPGVHSSRLATGAKMGHNLRTSPCSAFTQRQLLNTASYLKNAQQRRNVQPHRTSCQRDVSNYFFFPPSSSKLHNFVFKKIAHKIVFLSELHEEEINATLVALC